MGEMKKAHELAKQEQEYIRQAFFSERDAKLADLFNEDAKAQNLRDRATFFRLAAEACAVERNYVLGYVFGRNFR